MNEDEMTGLTPVEVAKLLRMSKDWVYDECKSGRLKHAKLGRSIRIRPADLAEYLAKLAK